MKNELLPAGKRLHGFLVKRSEEIPELRCQAVILEHEKTGARLVHLVNDDPNNLFCLGFRTPVYDNTGVPHILEHSVLSGSRKFPLKDPFKELLKGSLQTFLNAMTYPDKTLYPVSSQVETDFYNLVDVYCDAVFHPLLTRETFYQEGWHFDLPDPDGEVSIKGIVYNEMKGVFSDFHSHVTRKTMGALFPDTTYYFESGGEPEHIPELTYEQFVDFHRTYYHPSNAYIFLYGNLPTARTLAFLEENYLGEFDRRPVAAAIKPQPRWSAPRTLEIEAPAPKEDDGTASVILAWMLGPATDPLNGLLGQIFSRYLIGTQNSPLRRALIDSGLGEDLDEMSGFEGELVQTFFAVGLRKTKAAHAGAIRDLVRETLEKEVADGLDDDLLEGSIRRTEFRLREITDSGHYPYNLLLADRCYRSWIYDGDPLAHLRFAAPLARIKEEKAKGSEFFRDWLRTWLLENRHHLVSVVTASARLGEELGELTARQAAALSRGFTAEDRHFYHQLTKKLAAEQQRPPSPEALAALPRLSLADLPPKNREVATSEARLPGDIPWLQHPLFTAGIIYLDIGFDLDSVPDDLLPYLPLYTQLICRCGAAGLDYRQMATRISLATGGIGCGELCFNALTASGEAEKLFFRLFFHAKALPERLPEMIAILRDLFLEPQLDHPKLLKDIALEMRNDLQAGIPRSGHQFAISHAAARLSLARHIDEQLAGLGQLRFLTRQLAAADFSGLAARMKELHELIINRRRCQVSLTYDRPEDCRPELEKLLGELPASDGRRCERRFTPAVDDQIHGIEINSSVNYVARAWRLPGFDPELLGHLHLLARNLSTGLLWDKIRVEGGAYGGMAAVNGSQPIFACASYRDPNLARTLQVFHDSLAAIAAGLPPAEVEQSIIGTIGRLDAPKGPHDRGFGETIARLSGRSPAYRQQVREVILGSRTADLARTAASLLREKRQATSVYGSPKAFAEARAAGLRLVSEPLLPEPPAPAAPKT
ncbi:MAG: insulinase family protein [Deltaproteobacteria bacterium]|nr:insulinase family protein [Deltaproteobacteria bacterium]